MRTSLSFRLAGIPVQVDAAFLVVTILLGLGGRPGARLAGWVVAVFVSILVHELGHAAAFRLFGQTPRVRLWAWGGVTSGSGALSAGRDVVVSLAGPAAAMALLGLPAFVITRTPSFSSFTAYVFWHDLLFVSLWWSVLNLLPLLPFDGGHVARAVLRRAMGERGEAAALWLSISVAALGGAWALVERAPFVAMYAIFVAGYSAERLIERRDAPLRDELDRARSELTRDAAAAGAIANAVLERARGRSANAEASEVAAWAALALEDEAGAQEAVRRIGPAARPSPVLDGCLALATGDRDRGLERLAAGMRQHGSSYPLEAAMRCIARASATDELTTRLLDGDGRDGARAASALALGMHLIGRFHAAVEVAERVYADGRAERSSVAYNAACSAARGGWIDLGLRWLEAAIANGFDDARLLDTDEDLEALRGSPAFDAIRSSLSAAPSA